MSASYKTLFTLWEKSSPRRDTTVEDYQKILYAFADFVQKKALTDIVRRDIIDFRDYLLDSGQSARTASHKVGILKTLFRTAINYEMIASNPAEHVRTPVNHDRKRRIAFSSDDLKRIFHSPIYTCAYRSVSGGGDMCRFNPDKTFVKKAEGWLPLFNVLIFPHGVFEYELVGCEVGGTVTVTTEWPNLLGISNYMKYGPTPTSRGKSVWYAPRNLKLQGKQVSYTITDGQLGDDDLVANGVIKDPGGPVIQTGPLPNDAQPIPVPTLGAFATALLSLVLLLVGGAWQRRQGLRQNGTSVCLQSEVAHGP